MLKPDCFRFERCNSNGRKLERYNQIRVVKSGEAQ